MIPALPPPGSQGTLPRLLRHTVQQPAARDKSHEPIARHRAEARRLARAEPGRAEHNSQQSCFYSLSNTGGRFRSNGSRSLARSTKLHSQSSKQVQSPVSKAVGRLRGNGITSEQQPSVTVVGFAAVVCVTIVHASSRASQPTETSPRSRECEVQGTPFLVRKGLARAGGCPGRSMGPYQPVHGICQHKQPCKAQWL